MRKRDGYLFIVVLMFGLFLSVVSAGMSSSNYNITSMVVSEGGSDTSSTNYKTDFTVGGIIGNVTSALYKAFFGFFYSTLDTLAPTITWEPPTPDDGNTTINDWVTLNTTITDAGSPNNISAWFDWNKSLVGYWSFDSTNSTGVYDNSTYCYDNETEILTDEGWKLFSKLDKNEKVATLNQETGKLEWQTPTNWQEFDNSEFGGEMYRIETEKGELVVSSKHKVFASSSLYDDRPSVVDREKHRVYINREKNESVSIVVVPEENKDDSFISFIDCELEDKTFENMNSPFSNEVIFKGFVVIGVLDDFIDFSSEDFFKEGIFSSGFVNHSFTFISESEFIPHFYFNSSKNSSAELYTLPVGFSFNALFNSSICSGLGGSSSTGCQSIASQNSQSSSVISRVCLNLSNMSFFIKDTTALVTKSESNFREFSGDLINSVILNNNQDDYKKLSVDDFSLQQITETYERFENREEIYFLNSENEPVKINSIERIDYDGKIYDVDVENDIVLVRRGSEESGGFWSGNSNFGTFQGGLAESDLTSAKYGQGLEFDGVGDYISIPNNITDLSGNWAVNVWAKPYSDSNPRIFTLITDYDNLQVGYMASTLKPYIRIDNSVQSATTGLTSGVWQYIVYQVKDGTREIYINNIKLTLTSGGITTNGMYSAIGGGYTSYQMNGQLDEVKIFNRALSPEEINASYNAGLYRLYHNFTDLDNGVYNYSAYAIDASGNLRITDEREVTIDANLLPDAPSPNLVSVDGLNQTASDLNCSAVISDIDGDDLNVTVRWYKNDALELTVDYNNSYSSDYEFSAILESGNTSKSENWTCEMRVYDGEYYSSWANSSSLEILNTLPDVVVLDSPADNNLTTNRTPEFSWNIGTDDDDDILTYDLNLTCYPACSADNRLIEDISDLNHVLANYLQKLKDNNYYYNWTVRANDGEGVGEWATPRKIEIQSSIVMSLLNSTINMGTLTMSESKNTSTDNPIPFLLQNDGNCMLNVSINATDLWSTVSNPSEYFKYKVDNKSGEEGSFNWLDSITSWTELPATSSIAIVEFNWNEETDSAEVDVLVTVPPTEGAGDKSSIIYFESELGE
jgi:hypothetical protein